jgi:hypothetical protein
MFKKLLAGRQPSRLGDIPVVFDIFIFLNGANGGILVSRRVSERLARMRSSMNYLFGNT